MTVQKTISYWMRALRAGACMTQAEVAEEIGLHRPAVSEIEAGRRSAKVEEIDALAKLFGVQFGQFMKPPPGSPENRRDQIVTADP